VDRIDRHTVRINAATIGDLSVDYEYIKKIRASYYLLGALLGNAIEAAIMMLMVAPTETISRKMWLPCRSAALATIAP